MYRACAALVLVACGSAPTPAPAEPDPPARAFAVKKRPSQVEPPPDGKAYDGASDDEEEDDDTAVEAVDDEAASPIALIFSTAGTAMPTPRPYASVAAVGGRLVTIGGTDDTSPGAHHASNAVEIFDPALKRWANGTRMPTRRFSAGAAVLDGKIFVFGGHAKAVTDAVEVYDVATNRWSVLGPMIEKRIEPATTALDGKLYVFGGFTGTGSRYLDSVERFDPRTGKWLALGTRMPRDRKGGVAVAIANRILLFGGIDSRGGYPLEIDIYDPLMNTWAVSPSPLPQGVWLPTATVVGGSIVVTGGSSQGVDETEMRVYADVRAYDVATAKWSVLKPMVTPRMAHGAVVIGDRLYVTGGCRDGCNVKVGDLEIIALGRLARTKPSTVASVPIGGAEVAK